MTQHNRRLDAVLAIALIAFALLPWYRIEDGFLHFSWIEVLFSESARRPAYCKFSSSDVRGSGRLPF